MIENILLGIGLSMDASAVSMTNGLNCPKMKLKKVLFISFMFGFFQGFMPLIGYFAGSIFTDVIESITPWIALILLSVIGGKMIYEGIVNKEEEKETVVTFVSILLQAIATSIDALAVGLVFVGKSIPYAMMASFIIAITTFIISFVSVFIGKKFGMLFENKAQIVGGVILIGIGLKIFIEYLINVF